MQDKNTVKAATRTEEERRTGTEEERQAGAEEQVAAGIETGKTKVGYRDVLRQKEFGKLMLASVITRFGDSLDAIAFTWLVYQVTGSAAWSGFIFALNRVPTILLQPFAGAAVERRNKKYIMVAADVIRGIVVALLAWSYVAGTINPWIMAVFTLIISMVEAFEMPAATAMIPKLLDAEYYEFGMSFKSVVCTVVELIGTGLAGIIIGCFGVQAAILIDAATFFGAAFVELFLKVKETCGRKSGKDGVRQYITDLKDGFLYMKDRRVVRNFCLLALFINAMLVPVNSFQSPLVSDVLGEGSGLLSAMGIALVLGSGVGSFLFPYLSEKINIRRFILINGLLLAFSEGFITAGSHFKGQTMTVYAIASLAAFGMGFTASMLSSLFSVSFLKCVEKDYLSREAALLNAGATAAMPVTSFFLSFLVKFISVKNLFLICSAFCGIIFLCVWAFRMQVEEECLTEEKAAQNE